MMKNPFLHHASGTKPYNSHPLKITQSTTSQRLRRIVQMLNFVFSSLNSYKISKNSSTFGQISSKERPFNSSNDPNFAQ